MISFSGRAKIIDFGWFFSFFKLLMNHISSRVQDPSLKLTQGFVGTSINSTLGFLFLLVPFTAPEILLKEKYNEKGDVYSYAIGNIKLGL